MIRIEVDDTGIIRDCSASGDSFEIAAQICGAVCNLYHVLLLADKDIADQFRFAITNLTQEDGKAWDTSKLRKTGSGFCCYAVPPDDREESEQWNS